MGIAAAQRAIEELPPGLKERITQILCTDENKMP
jgi:hypothetical protein